jgi:hypothetical protein
MLKDRAVLVTLFGAQKLVQHGQEIEVDLAQSRRELLLSDCLHNHGLCSS